MMKEQTRKPWYRLRNIALGFLALFLVFIVWAGYWVYWALTVEPNPSTDYAAQLEQLARDAQPAGENGWPDVVRAIDIFKKLEDAFPKAERTIAFASGFDFALLYISRADANEIYGSMDDDTYAKALDEARLALDWLEANGAWDALADAGRKPNIWRPFEIRNEMLVGDIMVEWPELRAMARARNASLRIAFENDDVAGAQAALRDIVTLSRAASGQPWIIAALVGVSIHVLPNEMIIESSRDGRLSQAMLRALLDQFVANQPPANLTVSFEGERMMYLDTVQWLYSDDGNGDGYLLMSVANPMATFSDASMSNLIPRSESKLNNLTGLLYESRQEATANAHHAFDRLIDATHLAPEKQLDALRALEADVMATSNDLLLPMLFPALVKTASNYNISIMQHRAHTVFLAVELHCAVHGRPPATLQDLVPEFLAELPVDPLNGKPFGYRIVETENLAWPYVLYSLGRDGVDDGGAQSPDGRYDAINSHGVPGYDFVINFVDAIHGEN